MTPQATTRNALDTRPIMSCGVRRCRLVADSTFQVPPANPITREGRQCDHDAGHQTKDAAWWR